MRNQSTKLTGRCRVLSDQADILEMRVGEQRERDRITDGFVKARIGACSKYHRQSAVRHEVLHVSHLVMNCTKIVVVHL